MLTVEAADRLVTERLGTSWRAGHSRLVAALLGDLAERFAADAALWRTVGLVHDLDYEATRAEPQQHGVLVTRWLAGDLPESALKAVAAHDRISGIRSRSLLSDMLKLADALAILIDRIGADRLAALLDAEPGYKALEACLGQRAYLARILLRHGGARGLGPPELKATIMAGLAERSGISHMS